MRFLRERRNCHVAGGLALWNGSSGSIRNDLLLGSGRPASRDSPGERGARAMRKDKTLKCPDCGAQMILKKTEKFRTRDGKPRLFYSCSRFPACANSLGAHPDGTPLGIPVSKEVRILRTECHKLMDQVFGKWSDLSRRKKAEVYSWMKANAPKTHVAEMVETELRETMILLRKEIRKGMFHFNSIED